jgi:2-keto-4-pentenoate hydratase/2-oxohepta-3-ene-1,7-dioic acid hydratase in catechol pathway
VAVGNNFIEHAKEMRTEVPAYPLIFLKPPSALITTGQTILLPPQSKQIEHEAELAVVIKKKCRWLSIDEAKDAIFGYTIANDITARDLQKADNQWTRAKGFDTFLPLGPWIETEFEPSDAMISCHVNNSLRQMASTRDLQFDISQILAYITTFMTLLPGDVVLTGTPAGVSPLTDGDTVAIHIDGIGSLINPVRAENKTQYSRKVSLG